MNKKEVISEVSENTGINTTICTRVIDSLETLLSDELEKSAGIRNAFDKVHNLLNLIKDKEDETILIENEVLNKLAITSDATEEQCVDIVNTLINILNQKIEVSKSAKIKFDLAYRLTNFFKH